MRTQVLVFEEVWGVERRMGFREGCKVSEGRNGDLTIQGSSG